MSNSVEYHRVGSRFQLSRCCIALIMCSIFAVLLVFAAITVAATWSYPFHASCQVTWNIGLPCIAVNKALQAQMMNWTGPDNCAGGGQRCLYNVTSVSADELIGTHTTPVKRYIDDFSFKFDNSTNECTIEGYSRSRVWYAVLDYGTNYCNMENLITGAGLDTAPGYVEQTENSICTQYTSADCDVY